jgi:hypothetical protein
MSKWHWESNESITKLCVETPRAGGKYKQRKEIDSYYHEAGGKTVLVRGIPLGNDAG